MSILQEAMNNCPPSVTEITPALLLKDAAYAATAYVYYELSNYLNFRDWYALDLLVSDFFFFFISSKSCRVLNLHFASQQNVKEFFD